MDGESGEDDAGELRSMNMKVMNQIRMWLLKMKRAR